MSTLEMPPMDLEQGGATTSTNNIEEVEKLPRVAIASLPLQKKEEKVCFSDAEDDDDGSCCSQFYDSCISDSEILEVGVGVGSRRVLSVGSLSDLSVEIDNEGGCEIKVVLEGGVERDCRICHMGLESTSGENGGAIQLGCSCKDDLASAHKNCAETWFKIKGNKTCEICNSIARNVVGPSNSETMQQRNETLSVVSINVTGQITSTSTSETRRCLNSHRFVNFLLSCMVFAFVISWLFHFDITS